MKDRVGLSRQGGAVLVLSMVFLMLMTLLGVTMMRGGLSQMQIAGNTQYETQSFETAEGRLRAIEAKLNAVIDPTGMVTPEINNVQNTFTPPATITALAPFNVMGANPKIYVIRVTTTGSRGSTRILESTYSVVN
ncbi:MAG: PilX N-terminal domain-containing pilus assembly protein [Methylococcaceae bacterium]|nr:PilX N-terminal domain-containing pilus assembly protein [Methylococcaceae bacterium]